MTECERLLKELEEKAIRVQSAQRAARASNAGERERSDLKMLEQEYAALRQRTRDLVGQSGTLGDKNTLVKRELPRLSLEEMPT
jgi:hypothetical protein